MSLLGVQDFVTLHKLNVSGGDFAFLIDVEGKFTRLVIGGFEFDAS